MHAVVERKASREIGLVFFFFFFLVVVVVVVVVAPSAWLALQQTKKPRPRPFFLFTKLADASDERFGAVAATEISS